MSLKIKIALLLLGIIIVSLTCKPRVSAEKFSFDKLYSFAIQEDVKKIIETLKLIPEDSLNPDQKEIKEKYFTRFVTRSEKFDYKTHDSLITNILIIFHKYWTDVLMKDQSLRKSENIYKPLLISFIKNYAGAEGEISDVKDINHSLANILLKNGYHSRVDRTGNIMDLIIWTRQTIETYSVNIADTILNVPVIFIDSPVTFGWEGYATFDYYYPGGWTSADSLYCIKKDYDITSEKFRVSYLTHEAQHLTDSKIYSGYSGWLAEYRAKLAELSVAEKTVYNLINFFIKDSKNDSHLTHPYGEYRVISDLSREIFKENFVTDAKRWETISFQEINKASKKLLKQNSLTLTKKK
jgi:hypothetical protein